MTFSFFVVDDEPDVGEMFRQRFRREVRQGTYVLHFAASGEEALDTLANGGPPRAHRDTARHQHAGDGRARLAAG